jgi:ribosomal protein L19E
MLGGEIQRGPVGTGLATRDNVRNLIHQDNIYTKKGAGVETEILRQIITRLDKKPV